MSSYPPGMCPISLYRSLLQISMNQSCGKCVPCKDGLVEVDRMLHEILVGAADEDTPKRLKNMCRMITETADCAVGISAANLILDSLEQFADEYESHITHHSCVAQVKQTVPCVTLCPAHVNVPGYVALIKEEDYPFLLNTGRILYHYNAASITGRAPGLMDISGEGFIEVNFRDAERLQINNGERIRVSSRRGEITATARVGKKVSEGEVWMPFHFEDSPVNQLTNAAFDEIARIPEYKVCAVRLLSCDQ